LAFSLTYALTHAVFGYPPEMQRIEVGFAFGVALVSFAAFQAGSLGALADTLIWAGAAASVLLSATIARSYFHRRPHSVSRKELFCGIAAAVFYVASTVYLRRRARNGKATAARIPHRTPRSPTHLLLLPFVFGAAAAFCYVAMHAACAAGAIYRGGSRSFADYDNSSQALISIPLMVASIPVGLLIGNLLIWIVPPFRRYFAAEARARMGENFGTANQGLIRLAEHWVPPLIVFSFLVAAFGN
jgi:hypothetical protein